MVTTFNVESHVRTCHLGQRLTDKPWIRSSNTSDNNIGDETDVDVDGHKHESRAGEKKRTSRQKRGVKASIIHASSRLADG